MTPADYIRAARVPASLRPQAFGPWVIQRLRAGQGLVSPTEMALHKRQVGFDDYTLLRRFTDADIHLETPKEIVMEDSFRELRKHLPIWLAARGRVLVTGLGLGCVVRGLLAKPEVEHIDVVEIDRQIIRVVGPEFRDSTRVTIHHGDALDFKPPGRFDYAWHDLWLDSSESDEHLSHVHLRLMYGLASHCGAQGTWNMPRFAKRLIRRAGRIPLLG